MYQLLGAEAAPST